MNSLPMLQWWSPLHPLIQTLQVTLSGLQQKLLAVRGHLVPVFYQHAQTGILGEKIAVYRHNPIRALGFERRSFLQNKQVLRRRGIVAYSEEGKCLIMKQK